MKYKEHYFCHYIRCLQVTQCWFVDIRKLKTDEGQVKEVYIYIYIYIEREWLNRESQSERCIRVWSQFLITSMGM